MKVRVNPSAVSQSVNQPIRIHPGRGSSTEHKGQECLTGKGVGGEDTVLTGQLGGSLSISASTHFHQRSHTKAAPATSAPPVGPCLENPATGPVPRSPNQHIHSLSHPTCLSGRQVHPMLSGVLPPACLVPEAKIAVSRVPVQEQQVRGSDSWWCPLSSEGPRSAKVFFS